MWYIGQFQNIIRVTFGEENMVTNSFNFVVYWLLIFWAYVWYHGRYAKITVTHRYSFFKITTVIPNTHRAKITKLWIQCNFSFDFWDTCWMTIIWCYDQMQNWRWMGLEAISRVGWYPSTSPNSWCPFGCWHT
jgi:hypothetical protein